MKMRASEGDDALDIFDLGTFKRVAVGKCGRGAP